VDDVAATALASSLKQLQHLHLVDCALGDMACLAAIGQLTQLTELNLWGCTGLTRQSLMLLTGLFRLQQLHVDTRRPAMAAHAQEFWSAMQDCG
jgi:hypothetical protein